MRPMAVVASLLLATTAGAAGFRNTASLGPSGFRPPSSGDGVVFRANFATTGCIAAPVADTGQAITVTRASTRTCGDTLATCQNNELCVTSDGALVEPGRTNVLIRSAELDSAGWALAGLADPVTANQTTAPDGTNTAEKVTQLSAATGSTTHGKYQSFTYDAAAYSISIYGKAGTQNCATLDFANTGSTFAVKFNFSTGAVVATGGSITSASIESVGSGWYRAKAIATRGAGGSFPEFYLDNDCTAVIHRSFTGDGASYLYLWGAQLELGSAPSTYIATAGTSAARANESVAASVNVPDSEGCVRADVKLSAAAFAGTARVLGLAGAPSMLYVSTDTEASANDGTNTVSQAASSISAASRALRSSWSGSTLLVQTASGSTSGSYDGTFGLGLPVTVYIGSQAGTSNFLGGYVKNIRIGTRSSRCDL